MKDVIEAKLKKMEDNLAIYNAYVKDPAHSQENRNLVSFKMLFDMMSFTALHELVPDYKPSNETMDSLAKGLGGTSGYVEVVDGKVNVSPAYRALMSQKDDYLKNKNNGKLG